MNHTRIVLEKLRTCHGVKLNRQIFGCNFSTISNTPGRSRLRKFISRSFYVLSPFVLIGGIGYFIFLPHDKDKYLNSLGCYSPEEADTLTPHQIDCIKKLPLRFYTKLIGYIFNIEIPKSMRNSLYKSFLDIFNGNINEVELPLVDYPTFNSLFTRKLKPNCRSVDTRSNVIVSPVDGTVLYSGEIMNPNNNPELEQIKGIHFKLNEFSGVIPNIKNRLYYYIIYLSPGNYHRIHSPFNMNVEQIIHYNGLLLSVNPIFVRKVKNLFSINERIVLKGKSNNGFMSIGLVGATGVGSIVVNNINELTSNNDRKFTVENTETFNSYEFDDPKYSKITKGDEIGRFQMGSTVVVIFESPYCHYIKQSGDKVIFGEPICEIGKQQV